MQVDKRRHLLMNMLCRAYVDRDRPLVKDNVSWKLNERPAICFIHTGLKKSLSTCEMSVSGTRTMSGVTCAHLLSRLLRPSSSSVTERLTRSSFNQYGDKLSFKVRYTRQLSRNRLLFPAWWTPAVPTDILRSEINPVQMEIEIVVGYFWHMTLIYGMQYASKFCLSTSSTHVFQIYLCKKKNQFLLAW